MPLPLEERDGEIELACPMCCSLLSTSAQPPLHVDIASQAADARLRAAIWKWGAGRAETGSAAAASALGKAAAARKSFFAAERGQAAARRRRGQRAQAR